MRCNVCPHRCELSSGQTGLCRVRQNIGGEIQYLAADTLSSVCPFWSQCGAGSYCVNQPGCSWTCTFCVTTDDVNPELSAPAWNPNVELPMTQDGYLDKRKVIGRPTPLRLATTIPRTPEQVIEDWKSSNKPWFAIPSTEPSVHVEGVKEIFAGVKEAGGSVFIGTNGWWTEELLEILGPLVDAVDVGLKASGNELFLRRVAGASRSAPIFETIKGLVSHGVSVTVSDIPLYHAAWERDFEQVCDFISDEVPAREFPRLRLRPWGGRIPEEAFGHFKSGLPVRVQEEGAPVAGLWDRSRAHLILRASSIAVTAIDSLWIDTGHFSEQERQFLIDELPPWTVEEGKIIRASATPQVLGAPVETTAYEIDFEQVKQNAQARTRTRARER